MNQAFSEDCLLQKSHILLGHSEATHKAMICYIIVLFLLRQVKNVFSEMMCKLQICLFFGDSPESHHVGRVEMLLAHQAGSNRLPCF